MSGIDASATEFVLNAFNDDMSMNVAAALQEGVSYELDVSAVAVYVVDISHFTNVFKFAVDSSDIDDITNVALETADVKYFVDGAQWDPSGNHAFNPANASLDTTIRGEFNTSGDGASNPIYSNADSSRNLVKHDFIRHIAQDLFNTHFAADLFQNEVAIKNNLENQGKNVVNNIAGVIADASNADSVGFFTNADTSDNNLSRELLNQIIELDPQRLDASGGVFDVSANPLLNGSYQIGQQLSIPFVHGDSVSFKVTINPAAGQETQVDTARSNPVSSRSYRIKIFLRDNDSSGAFADVEPTDDQNTIQGNDPTAPHSYFPHDVSII